MSGNAVRNETAELSGYPCYMCGTDRRMIDSSRLWQMRVKAMSLPQHRLKGILIFSKIMP
jgi:hypothetical protein